MWWKFFLSLSSFIIYRARCFVYREETNETIIQSIVYMYTFSCYSRKLGSLLFYASLPIRPVNFSRVLSSGSWRCRHFMMSGRLLCLNVWLRPEFCARTSSYIISRYTISRSEHPKPFPVLLCPPSFFYSFPPAHMFRTARETIFTPCKIINLFFYRRACMRNVF